MNLEQFIEKLPDNFSSLDLELIEKAYRYAEEAHKGQTLASGLPHISHCASVAAILAELSVPPELIKRTDTLKKHTKVRHWPVVCHISLIAHLLLQYWQSYLCRQN